MSLVLEQPVHLGVGIDESTALIVEPDGRWRIAGESAAIVYDARKASIVKPGATLGATDIVMHVLPAGSRYDPRTGDWQEWPLPGNRPSTYAVYVDEHDMVWLSDWGSNALVGFDPTTETFEQFPLPLSGSDFTSET